MVLNYSVMKEEVFNQLGSNKVMVLATSFEDRVTARNMNCIIMGQKYADGHKPYRDFLDCRQNKAH